MHPSDFWDGIHVNVRRSQELADFPEIQRKAPKRELQKSLVLLALYAEIIVLVRQFTTLDQSALAVNS